MPNKYIINMNFYHILSFHTINEFVSTDIIHSSGNIELDLLAMVTRMLNVSVVQGGRIDVAFRVLLFFVVFVRFCAFRVFA